MTAPRSLAEAQAQCRALGVNLSAAPSASGQLLGANGRPMPVSECADLLMPFCPGGGVRAVVGRGELPVCADESISPAKAAVLLADAHAKQAGASGPPWLWIGGGVLAVGLVAYLALR